MGINSTEVAYAFGQMGSGFTDQTEEVTAPAGKVIVAITFLADTTFTSMTADTKNAEIAYFSNASAGAGNGAGASEIDNTTVFPAGLTVYGRWTKVDPAAASTTGGIICYFGE